MSDIRLNIGLNQNKVLRDVGGGNFAELVAISSSVAVVSASFVSPSGTKSYVSGDLIADSTVAATVNGNVTPGSAAIMALGVAGVPDHTGMVRRLRLKTNDTAFANKSVRVHLFRDRPTVTNGDDAAFLTTESAYLGYCDVILDRHFSDAEKGFGVPAIGSEWSFEPSVGTVNIYALLECRDTVAGGASKTWTLVAEVLRD